MIGIRVVFLCQLAWNYSGARAKDWETSEEFGISASIIRSSKENRDFVFFPESVNIDEHYLS